jgi:hypothetical protein
MLSKRANINVPRLCRLKRNRAIPQMGETLCGLPKKLERERDARAESDLGGTALELLPDDFGSLATIPVNSVHLLRRQSVI